MSVRESLMNVRPRRISESEVNLVVPRADMLTFSGLLESDR